MNRPHLKWMKEKWATTTTTTWKTQFCKLICSTFDDMREWMSEWVRCTWNGIFLTSQHFFSIAHYRHKLMFVQFGSKRELLFIIGLICFVCMCMVINCVYTKFSHIRWFLPINPDKCLRVGLDWYLFVFAHI